MASDHEVSPSPSPVNRKRRKKESITESGDELSPPVEKKRRENGKEDENNSVKNDEINTDPESEESHAVAPVRMVEKQMELEDVLKGIEDVNEPSCMDRILMYLGELNDEDYWFMELLVDKLRGEKITWEQPWYQQSNSLSRPLKDVNNKSEDKPYRTDTICKAESDKIQENWDEFRRLYEVPDKLICLARWKNKDKSRLPNTPEELARRFVVAYLARGLQRTIYQVFRHIMTHFGGSVKGPYSKDEEKIMKVCFMHHPNNSVTLLSRVLGREPRGIYKRLQQLFHGKPEKKKLKWTLPLATKLLRLILKYTQLPLEDLKYRKIDKSVWLKIQKKFDHNYIHLQGFWYAYLHVQIFVKETVKINKLRKRVFKRLKTSSYQVWTDIRWKDLVKEFPDGMTHRFLYAVSRQVVGNIPEYLKQPLPLIADSALNKLHTIKFRKRRLRTLQLNENRELEVVKYNETKFAE
uniref:Uncharacterized protein n=1 Tax=Heliothis virescens TaxID=7102 RepID=A0A2A4K5A8_HELVI